MTHEQQDANASEQAAPEVEEEGTVLPTATDPAVSGTGTRQAVEEGASADPRVNAGASTPIEPAQQSLSLLLAARAGHVAGRAERRVDRLAIRAQAAAAVAGDQLLREERRGEAELQRVAAHASGRLTAIKDAFDSAR